MSINICGIGDVMLGENIHHYRRGITTRFQGQFHRLISSKVRAVLSQADLVVGNLECSLLPDEELASTPFERAIYTAPESALHFFDGWGWPLVLNVANNHFGQHGETAMAYTLDRLGKQQSFYVIGRTPEPLELVLHGHRVLLLGVSLVQDACNAGYFKSSMERLLHDLDWGTDAKRSYRILSIHWGEEYLTLPSKSQRELAEMLAESGIDLILGHHPHVIQPVRRVGDTIVAYSHGNFIFDQNFSRLTQTGLMTISTLGSREVCCYILKSRGHRIRTMNAIESARLERFCRRHMKPWTPLLMRIFMKIEMISHGCEVPKRVWQHFGLRVIDRYPYRTNKDRS